MKSILNFCGAFVFILFSFQSYAQIGIRGGVQLANLSFSPEDSDFSPGTKLGLGLGLFYKLSVGENLIIQPEVNFMQQGTKIEAENAGISAKVTISANYIQVPVMIKYGFGNRESTNFFLQAGPYVGVGIGKVKTETCLNGNCDTDESSYGSGEDEAKKMDFGVQVGAGLNINSSISLDARYLLGLSKINNDSDTEIKHKGINLSLGYTF